MLSRKHQILKITKPRSTLKDLHMSQRGHKGPVQLILIYLDYDGGLRRPPKTTGDASPKSDTGTRSRWSWSVFGTE